MQARIGKLQAPKKGVVSAPPLFSVWCLVLLWSLELDVWCFNADARGYCRAYNSGLRCSKTPILSRTDLTTSSEISATIISSRSSEADASRTPDGSMMADRPQQVTPASTPARFARTR